LAHLLGRLGVFLTFWTASLSSTASTKSAIDSCGVVQHLEGMRGR
jgi:hypothetical protein